MKKIIVVLFVILMLVSELNLCSAVPVAAGAVVAACSGAIKNQQKQQVIPENSLRITILEKKQEGDLFIYLVRVRSGYFSDTKEYCVFLYRGQMVVQK